MDTLHPTRPRATSRATLIRDRIARVLMLLSALGALSACLISIGAVGAAGPLTQQVEAWRLLGFVMFTGIFALLALWPRRYPGLWELVLANKAVLTIVEALLIRTYAAHAQDAAIIDGILTVMILAAYLLSRGYTSWRPRRAV